MASREVLSVVTAILICVWPLNETMGAVNRVLFFGVEGLVLYGLFQVHKTFSSLILRSSFLVECSASIFE